MRLVWVPIVVILLASCGPTQSAAPPGWLNRSAVLPPQVTPATESAPQAARQSALPQRAADQVAGPESSTPADPTGPLISIDLKDADVRNVLRLIADVSGRSIVVTDDVEGKVTMHLSEMPWEAALDAVLRSLNLGRRVAGTVVRVSTLEQLQADDEQAKLAIEATRAIEPMLTRVFRLEFVKATHLAALLRGRSEKADDVAAEGLLSPRGTVVVDPLSNTIIVRDIREGVQNAVAIVEELDVPVDQVLIEASIVEVAADFARSLGVQWGYHASIGPQTGTSTGKNFPGIIEAGGAGLGTGSGGVPLIADFPAAVAPGAGSALDLALGSLDGSQALDLRLTALERDGYARIISRPRIVTLNNVAATIKSLTVLRVKLPSTDTIIGGEGEVTQSTATERIETGIILVVTPQVSSDGFVLLDLFAKSSQADFTRTVDGIPTETSREANSHVLVRDGQTVVLGGIYAEVRGGEEQGMPFLRDLPGLGWLFKREDKSRRREDLLVFLTPHILAGLDAPLPSAPEVWQDRFLGGDADAGKDDG